MKIMIVVALVMLALVGTAVLTSVRTIVPPIERTGDSGWLVTAPRADETGYAALPYLFAPERRSVLSLLSGVALVALLVVSTAFALYTIRIAYRGEPPARRT